MAGRKGKQLTVELILAWAEAHHARTGQWPNQRSGPVADAPGETWNAVNLALNHGRRGLPGPSSLARLLDRHLNRHRPGADQPFRPWTPEEDDLVRTLPPQEVAQQTGHTLAAVYKRRHRIGAVTARDDQAPRRWTLQEDQLVRTLPVQEAARRTGRSLTAVYIRRHQLGLGHH
jgi:hypothetical protein